MADNTIRPELALAMDETDATLRLSVDLCLSSGKTLPKPTTHAYTASQNYKTAVNKRG